MNLIVMGGLCGGDASVKGDDNNDPARPIRELLIFPGWKSRRD